MPPRPVGDRYDALREPMKRALEALVMERQTEGKATFPPFAQKIFERGISEGFRDGERKGFHDGERKGFHDGELKGKQEGELKGKHEGELKGKRDVLLRLLARAGIALSDEQRSRILGCDDGATLDRWVENVLEAKTAADVLS